MLPERAIYVVIIVLLALAGVIWGLVDTHRIIEAPFLYATGMVLILCPQLYVAASETIQVPDDAYRVFCIMVILCTTALYLGYFQAPVRQQSSQMTAPRRVINHRRMYPFGLICALAGMAGAYQLSTMGTVTVWRGWAVYWLNLTSLIVPGIILLLLAYLHDPKPWRLIPVLIFLYVPLSWIFDSGRRSVTLTLPLTLAMPFLIYRRSLRIPRWVIFVGLMAGLTVVYVFPTWRSSFAQHQYLQTIRDHPPSEIIDSMLHGNNGHPLEITDGMIITGARYELGNYQYGTDLYNLLVQNYVPGSLIGYDLKDSLFIHKGISNDWVTEVYGIPVAYYTAKSGYEDLFSQFSFFGCIVMYLIGRGFRKLHESALQRWDARAIIFLSFFISFPAAIAYGSITLTVVLAVPELIIAIVAIRWCTDMRFPVYVVRSRTSTVPAANLLQF